MISVQCRNHWTLTQFLDTVNPIPNHASLTQFFHGQQKMTFWKIKMEQDIFVYNIFYFKCVKKPLLKGQQ